MGHSLLGKKRREPFSQGRVSQWNCRFYYVHVYKPWDVKKKGCVDHLRKMLFFLECCLLIRKMYVVKHWKLTTRAQQEARQFTPVMNRSIHTLRFIRRLGSYDYRKVNQESKLTKNRAHLSPSGQKPTLASTMSNPNFLR